MVYNMFVSTFGFPIMKIQSGIPIEVGAYSRENFLYELHDDSGDNISDLNEYYGELTGLYWIWKNREILSDDLIGFSHYNKTLLINKKKMQKALVAQKYDFIVCKRQCIPAYRYGDDLLKLCAILERDYPQYYKCYKKLYNDDGSSNNCNAKNMFITNGENFKEFCAFLFELLEKCRSEIGVVEDRKIKRYNALIAERIFSVYLIANRKKVKEVDIRYDRTSLTVAKIVINRLPFSGNSKILACLRKKVAKSSYHTRT